MINFNELPDVVGIVGSRDFPPDRISWVKTFVNKLNAGTIVVSGGARGVDTAAERAAKARKDLYFKPYYVEDFEWKLKGKGVGHFRNSQLINFVHYHKGIIVIFYTVDEKGVMTPGSTNVVKTCLKLNVPYILVSDLGEIAGTKR